MSCPIMRRGPGGRWRRWKLCGRHPRIRRLLGLLVIQLGGCSVRRWSGQRVRDVARSVPFYRDVLGMTVQYSDPDMAALQLGETQIVLHADHTYDKQPWASRLRDAGKRGLGAEIRILGIDPDAAERRGVHPARIMQLVNQQDRHVELADFAQPARHLAEAPVQLARHVSLEPQNRDDFAKPSRS